MDSIAPPQFEVEIPAPRMLTSKEELAMTRAAYARDPQSVELTSRFIRALVMADEFEEAIEIFERNPNNASVLNTVQLAYLARETEAGNHRAAQVAERSIAASTTDRGRAIGFAALAKAQTRLGQKDLAERSLEEALRLDPGQKDAYKRLFALRLERDPEAALALARSAVARGIVHARVLGSLVLALARLGRMDEAREAEGSSQFLRLKYPKPPAGWASADEFHNALAEEILNHPDMRYERYGTASTQTWRIDQPALQRSRIFSQLQSIVRQEILDYVAGLPQNGHPVLLGTPKRVLLRNWVVVTQGEGHETWHVHQNGWLSGTYYIHVQDHIANGAGPEGCIAFGLPGDVIGRHAADAFGERIERPQTGLMMHFPSHVYHRTYPHFGPGRRICYAFDLIPLDDE